MMYRAEPVIVVFELRVKNIYSILLESEKNVVVPASLKHSDIFDHPDKQLKIVKAYRDLVRE